jgi:hypothetical protein
MTYRLQKAANVVQLMYRLVLVMLSASLTEIYAAATRGVPAQVPLPRVRRRPAPVTSATASNDLLVEGDFTPINEPGFGDPWNVYPWSMQWWHGKLLVGTGRGFPCVEYYLLHETFPFLQRYPPRFDPDRRCPDCIFDLPLQAEIWCYTPETTSWERLFQSPNDLDVPGQPGARVARDMGFRNMILFRESDGTEALYVAGVSARALNRRLPPPRLLRSTGGRTFAAVPAEPDTALGRLDAVGFRGLAAYRGRLFVTAGGLFGPGRVYEARNPAGGNDSFRPAISPDLQANNLAVFNDCLYLGLHHPIRGYAVVKTEATGASPFRVRTVVPYGAFRGAFVGNSVMSMYVFGDALYVGTDAPAELIRIHPDDRWDLVVGKPRQTPQGMKYPLSGMHDGFDDATNRIIQHMHAHDGWLYIGTYNGAGKQLAIPALGPWVRPRVGFDLYATRDGVHFSAVSHSGLGSNSDTLRTCASTPFGLFLGAIDEEHGARIYLGHSTRSGGRRS